MAGQYGRLAEELRDIIDDSSAQPDRAFLEEDDCGCGSLRGALDAIGERRSRYDADLLRDEP